MKKKEDIRDYCSAHEAAQILSAKHGRPIKTDYISKMALRKKHPIRTVRISEHMFLYHREDVATATIRMLSKAS